MLKFLTFTWYLVEVFVTGGNIIVGGVGGEGRTYMRILHYVKFVCYSLSYAWKNWLYQWVTRAGVITIFWLSVL